MEQNSKYCFSLEKGKRPFFVVVGFFFLHKNKNGSSGLQRLWRAGSLFCNFITIQILAKANILALSGATRV